MKQMNFKSNKSINKRFWGLLIHLNLANFNALKNLVVKILSKMVNILMVDLQETN